MHLGHGADGVDLVRPRFVQPFVQAGHQGDDAAGGQRAFDQTQAAGLADGQGQPHHGIDHQAAQGQHSQVIVKEAVDAIQVGHPAQVKIGKFFGFVEHFVLEFVVVIVEVVHIVNHSLSCLVLKLLLAGSISTSPILPHLGKLVRDCEG